MLDSTYTIQSQIFPNTSSLLNLCRMPFRILELLNSAGGFALRANIAGLPRGSYAAPLLGFVMISAHSIPTKTELHGRFWDWKKAGKVGIQAETIPTPTPKKCLDHPRRLRLAKVI